MKNNHSTCYDSTVVKSSFRRNAYMYVIHRTTYENDPWYGNMCRGIAREGDYKHEEYMYVHCT